MASSVIKALKYESIADKITVNGSYTSINKTAYIEGNIVHFFIELYMTTVAAGTRYTIATIADGYKPKYSTFFTGHTTNSNFVPQSLLNCCAWQSGDITILAANGNGNYVFVEGTYPI